jgi:hypothetical protein
MGSTAIAPCIACGPEDGVVVQAESRIRIRNAENILNKCELISPPEPFLLTLNANNFYPQKQCQRQHIKRLPCILQQLATTPIETRTKILVIQVATLGKEIPTLSILLDMEGLVVKANCIFLTTQVHG